MDLVEIRIRVKLGLGCIFGEDGIIVPVNFGLGSNWDESAFWVRVRLKLGLR